MFWAGLFSLLGIYFCLTTLADQHDLATTLLYGFAILYLLSSTVTLLYNAGRPELLARAENDTTEERPMNPEKFYITTPIYYPSDKLHIGHTYCTVATDAMARYKRLTGCEVMFLRAPTSTARRSRTRPRRPASPQGVCGPHRGGSGRAGSVELMTSARPVHPHHRWLPRVRIQKIFKKMYEKGDIYKGKYVGKYCKPCESFWTESQLVDGKCPDCGRDVVDAEEEAYFFRLSKYADRVQHLRGGHRLLEPRSPGE